jgi:nucleoside-diphosphate-sugar epimerase
MSLHYLDSTAHMRKNPVLSMQGALPARFRQSRALIVGCGDVGLRTLPLLRQRGRGLRVFALTSSPEKVAALRAAGCTPIVGNLDKPVSLRRLSGLADHVIHLAPPPSEQWAAEGQSKDPRTMALIRALRLRSLPRSFTYASTSGVYGDCSGAWVDEARPVNPHSARAQRRVDAENAVRYLGRSGGVSTRILRIPGIYAPDREGGTPRARLAKRTPVLHAKDDVYTNHIHANDLARAVQRAVFLGKPQRCINVNDDTALKMGDYFDLAADLYGMPRPPRIDRGAAQTTLPLLLLSFMSESRRLRNGRMKRELRLRLRYPTVGAGLKEEAQPGLPF